MKGDRAMSAGYYLLVRFDDRSKLPRALETLDGLKSIQRWDAVDGYYSLVVKADDLSVLDEISQLDGFSETARCDIKIDNERLSNDSSATSYLFIETEKNRQNSLQNILQQHEIIQFVSPTTGDFDLVAIIAADTFDKIDRAVNNELRLLDGVLRIKQDRIIHLNRI
jgi:hypothetical protein